MDMIKLAIGSSLLLLNCGAYAQTMSEKIGTDKKAWQNSARLMFLWGR
nr:hypothetical protein [Rosenbergiella nectarea]